MLSNSSSSDNSLFWVLQIVFGVLIARTPFLYSEIIFSPLINYIQFTALIIAYVVTLWSWIDFSQIMTYTNYSRYVKFDMVRFIIDFLIVIFYTLLFLSIQNISNDGSIIIYVAWFPIIFFGYVSSGFARRYKYGKIASRVGLLIKFTIAYSILLLLYFVAYIVGLTSIFGINLNLFTILVFGLTYVFYRIARRREKSRDEKEKKQNGLIIGVDVDGVIANQIDILLPIIRGKFGRHYEYEDIDDWELEIGDTNIAEIIVSHQQHDSIVSNMKIHEDSREVINKLYKDNIIDIVTARPESSSEATKKWLSDNGIKYDKFLHLKENKKSMHDMDILIDDYLGNIKDYLEESDGLAILFNQPWNKDRSELKKYMVDDRLFIIDSWSQISSIMDYIISKKKN